MSALDIKIAQMAADIDLLHKLVHGDATVVVSTTGGPVPSFKKLQADNLAGLISSATTARDQAQAAASNINSFVVIARDYSDRAGDYAETASLNAYQTSLFRDQASSYKNLAQTAATNAGLSETNAATSAGVATTQANIATDAAGVATGVRDDVFLARDVAQEAADEATTKAGETLTLKNAAQTSASNASTSEGNALAHKNATEVIRTDIEAARDMVVTKAAEAAVSKTLAQNYANAPLGVEVEPGKFSAYHWAQQVAATVTGGVIFRGPWDASSGEYPEPNDPDVPGDMYKVTVAGTVLDTPPVDFAPGDSIIYQGDGTWFKLDGTDAVQTVNGRVGNIVLDKSDVGLANVDNTSDFAKPVSMAQQNAINAKADQTFVNALTNSLNDTITALNSHTAATNPHGTTKANVGLSNVENKDSATIRSEITSLNVTTALGYTPLNATVVSTDGTMASDSDAKVPTEKAVRSYVAASFAANDVQVLKGGFSAAGNPNYPAADAGWTYRVTAAGRVGGAAGPVVEINDMLICVVDASIAGDHATVGANWVITQTNIDGAVTGPASAVSGRVAVFSGTSGRIIADSGLALAGNNTGDETAQSIGNLVNAATAKATPVDADMLPIADTAAGNIVRKFTWSSLKSAFLTALGPLVAALPAKASGISSSDALMVADSAASNATKKLNLNAHALWLVGLFGAFFTTQPVKNTPADADEMWLYDSADVNVSKKITWGGLKTALASAAWNFTGAITIAKSLVKMMREVVTISATAANGTIVFDALTQGVLYYTANASSNFGLNVRGDAGTSLNTLMGIGESLTVVFMNTNGGTAYYANAFQIDGVARTVKWMDGAAPTSGNASSIDVYSYVMIKTADATFTVLGQRTKYA